MRASSPSASVHAQAKTGRMYPRRITMLGTTAVVGGYMKSMASGMATADDWGSGGHSDDPYGHDFQMVGPFTPADATGASASSVYEDLKSYNGGGGWDQYEVGLLKIDSTGTPTDIVSYGGTGMDGLWGLSASSDQTRVAASGYFIGNLTFGATTLYTNNGNMHHYDGRDGFIALLDADLAPIWAKTWPVTTLGSDESSLCGDVDFDASNNVYGVGYQCNATCSGVISHHAAADGALVTEKVFEDVQHLNRVVISTDGSGDVFVTGRMYTSTGTGSTGARCEASECALTTRLSGTDFSVIWARTIEGGGPSSTYTGDLRHDEVGEPYVYVTFRDAAESGPVSLDSGTPYSGCKDDTTSVVTPAYDVDATKMVTAADCPSGSTFVATSSADAVWAASANTGVHCQGNTEDSCIMKYHAFTGKPVWATTVPAANAVVPMPDGTVHAVGQGYQGTFATTKTPNTNTYWGYRAVLDGATGEGKSVAPFGGDAATWVYDAAQSGGDLTVVTGFRGSATQVDYGFTIAVPDEIQERHTLIMHVKTSGTKDSVPSCLSTCSNDESTVIEAGKCFIDGLCYADGDSGATLGLGCMVCDPSKSQTLWSMSPSLGVTQCFIDDTCYEGEHSGNAADTPAYHCRSQTCFDLGYSRYDDIQSECRYCDPAKSITEWSLKDGYTYTGESTPNDCLADDTGSTDSGDSTDTTTQTGGGTLSESDGGQALVAGALAPLAALLL